MHPHRDLHVMEPLGILWDMQAQALYRTVLSLATTRSSCTHRISAREVPIHGMKAVPGSVALTINRSLYCRRNHSVRYRLAAALSVIPASAHSSSETLVR